MRGRRESEMRLFLILFVFLAGCCQEYTITKVKSCGITDRGRECVVEIFPLRMSGFGTTDAAMVSGENIKKGWVAHGCGSRLRSGPCKSRVCNE